MFSHKSDDDTDASSDNAKEDAIYNSSNQRLVVKLKIY